MFRLRGWTFTVSLLLTIGLFFIFARVLPSCAGVRTEHVITLKLAKKADKPPVDLSYRPFNKKTKQSLSGRPARKTVNRALKKQSPPRKQTAPREPPPILKSKKSGVVIPHGKEVARPDQPEQIISCSNGDSGEENGNGLCHNCYGNSTGGDPGHCDSAPENEVTVPHVDRDTLLAEFQAMVTYRLNAIKAYPDEAREKGQEGTVIVSFLVKPGGFPGDPILYSSSGYSALDMAATDAVRAAAPFTPFPEGFPSGIRVKAKVTFSLTK
ncbi:MAG: TonB family protein [Candidatus Eremiobacteraeota bacterium]|nr:TonB family protein [Candidatus Eremiobacteraeota bacterium]